MELVVLYGPPGVGKLTVADALAKKTGYKVLHNHLTIELLCSLFAWGSKPYNELIQKYRFDLLETAAKYNVRGVITTFVYGAEAKEQDMKELARRMKRHQVKICFVELLCTQQELEKRIKHGSRKKFTKIRHVNDLRDMMKKFDTLAKVPFANNLTIDTTKLSPTKTARRIFQHFKL